MLTLGDMFATLAWCVRHPLRSGWFLWYKWSGFQYPISLPTTDRIGDVAVDLSDYDTFEIPRELADWDIRLQDLYWLIVLLKDRKPSRILEFGTFTGLTTLYLARYSEPDTQVVTLDSSHYFEQFKPDPRLEVGMRFVGTEWASRIRLVDADLADLDPHSLGKFDFIFVDADHHYESVKRDTKSALQMLEDGGTIVWHDYQPEVQGGGVVRCLNELNRNLESIQRIRGTHLAFWDKPRTST